MLTTMRHCRYTPDEIDEANERVPLLEDLHWHLLEAKEAADDLQEEDAQHMLDDLLDEIEAKLKEAREIAEAGAAALQDEMEAGYYGGCL